MSVFKADSKDNFGALGLISHFFISVGIILVIIGLLSTLFSGPEVSETIGYFFGIGTASVLGGVALGFLSSLI